ncbi:hypothetical protein GCM10011316_03250 [Roseibium aquae]|uniref:Uncharacterized protein n=1 Tax=Roseibium aquae TaxID=1323746 RepID=A0A916WW37_9HYPH|nr:hypothetical protein [Roseibium aquae]GGB34531.1 hypothetical protein GCM10011316_03250 [Roseibium aquae]
MTSSPSSIEPMAREEYEAICREHGHDILDDDTLSLLVELHELDSIDLCLPSMPLIEGVELAINLQRGQTVKIEEPIPTPRTPTKHIDEMGRVVPEKYGQLWEGCEQCGREPVQMPLFLCEDCWPKAST